MSTLVSTTTDDDGNIVNEILASESDSIHLATTGTYLDKDIIFNVNISKSGVDTSDATAAAEDIVSGKTAYVNEEKITGTLEYINYYTGTDEPASSLGTDGDLYFQTAE